MRRRYRIVLDYDLGYVAQVRHWWWPLQWFRIASQVFTSPEQAEKFVADHRPIVVKNIN